MPAVQQLSESGKNLEECLCSHGEENAIVQASYHGISIKDSIIYTTFSPCLLCTKMIINAGIKEVMSDPAEWARLNVKKYGADMVTVQSLVGCPYTPYVI
jgi:dCMP deaminase